MYVKAIFTPLESHHQCESMEGTHEKDAMCEFVKKNPDLLNHGKSDLEGNNSISNVSARGIMLGVFPFSLNYSDWL